MSSKDKKYWDILNSCINLEISRGHLKWKISDLHRKSKVSRALIYYDFGKNKNNIVIEACHYFGSFFSGTNDDLMNLYSKGEVSKALYLNKQALLKIPSLIPFYFMFKDSKDEIGEVIRGYEAKGIKKRRHFYPHLSETEARALFALQMGLSLFGKISTQKEIEVGLNMIKLTK